MADPREQFDSETDPIFINPGDPVPQPKIIMPNGDVLTPEDYAALAELEDDADLRAAYEAAGGDDVDPDDDEFSDLQQEG